MIIKLPVSYTLRAAFDSIGAEIGSYYSDSFSPARTKGRGRRIKCFGVGGLTEAQKATFKEVFLTTFADIGGTVEYAEFENIYGRAYPYGFTADEGFLARVILP